MQDFIREIKSFNPTSIYFLCSGGWDSTYMLLKLYREFKDIPNYILYNNTYMELQECRELIYRLSFITNIPIHETFPKGVNVGKVMRKSFLALPKAKKLVKEEKYHKKIFPCCRELKENPAKKFYKKMADERPLFLSGIKKGDSKQRRIFLFQLENQKTYLRFHKDKKVTYGYPLRDITNSEVERFIKTLSFQVKHSGCRFCPILLLFDIISERERYSNSRQYYFRLTGKKWRYKNNMCLTDYLCWKE